MILKWIVEHLEKNSSLSAMFQDHSRVLWASAIYSRIPNFFQKPLKQIVSINRKSLVLLFLNQNEP